MVRASRARRGARRSSARRRRRLRRWAARRRRAQLAIAADVPVVPGTTEALARRRRSHDRSPSEFGYPVLLKAAAGGGGKGMRVVREPRRDERRARRRAARGKERLRRRCRLRREIHRRSSPRRDSGARRQARQHALAPRARVLRATPASEDDRGSAERRGHARAASPDGRDRRARRASRRLCERRHLRVPPRPRRQLLFPRDEHAAPGGASRSRNS